VRELPPFRRVPFIPSWTVSWVLTFLGELWIFTAFPLVWIISPLKRVISGFVAYSCIFSVIVICSLIGLPFLTREINFCIWEIIFSLLSPKLFLLFFRIAVLPIRNITESTISVIHWNILWSIPGILFIPGIHYIPAFPRVPSIPGIPWIPTIPIPGIPTTPIPGIPGISPTIPGILAIRLAAGMVSRLIRPGLDFRRGVAVPVGVRHAVALLAAVPRVLVEGRLRGQLGHPLLLVPGTTVVGCVPEHFVLPLKA
jgi:hypothetical protein